MTTPQIKKEEELNIESLTWGGLSWVNIERPTVKETAYLAEHYPFHQFNLDDVLSRTQHPKIDEYKDHLFFIFHFSIYDRETRISTHSQVSVFIAEKYLITIHSGKLKPLVKLFRDCQINEEAQQENFCHGSGYLLYRILDRMVDAYFPILYRISSLLEDVEDAVFDESVVAAQELAILRRNIITQRRILFPNRKVIAELEGKLKRFTTVDMSVYWGDLMDHMNKICETLDEAKEVIEVYKDTDYVLSTERVNRIIRVLTILSAIVLPFLVVSSLFGMNIVLPGGLEKGNLRSFLSLLAIMSLISGGMLYFFHRKRWI